MRNGVYCNSGEQTWYGSFANVQGCADACAEKPECKYFIYGTGSLEARCYLQEKSLASCPAETADEYDFYELTRPKGNYRLIIMFHTNNTRPICSEIYTNNHIFSSFNVT